MKICFLCDRNSQDFCGINLQKTVLELLTASEHEITTIVLVGDEISPCLGCFKCWITTPGLCVLTADEINSMARQVINSDVLLLLSQINYGGYSYDIKAFLDRFIPNILPFFEIVEAETHHKKRYKKYPTMLSIGYGASSQQENSTFHKLVQRNALNFRAPHFGVLSLNADTEAQTAISTFLYSNIKKVELT